MSVSMCRLAPASYPDPFWAWLCRSIYVCYKCRSAYIGLHQHRIPAPSGLGYVGLHQHLIPGPSGPGYVGFTVPRSTLGHKLYHTLTLPRGSPPTPYASQTYFPKSLTYYFGMQILQNLIFIYKNHPYEWSIFWVHAPFHVVEFFHGLKVQCYMS